MKQKGFTLIETLVAIFILTLTMGALMTLTAQGFFSVRYARNQITANQLLQESLEYVRNTRDGAAQTAGSTWSAWLSTYANCMNTTGCTVDAYLQSGNVYKAKSGGATLRNQPSLFFYQDTADTTTATKSFYGYQGVSYGGLAGVYGYQTTYRRRIIVETISADQVLVTGEITWQNGTAWKTLTQSILITNWAQNWNI